MVNIFDVQPAVLIKDVAEELKKNDAIKPPVWSAIVKTGAHKERAPVEKDWWYIRAAAVLRTLHKLGPIGVSKLRKKYGGKKRRGHKPAEFRQGSGNIIRKILQQLETAKLAIPSNNPSRKGRVLSPQGMSLLANAAKKHIPAEVLKKSEQKKKDEPVKAEKIEKSVEKPATEVKPKQVNVKKAVEKKDTEKKPVTKDAPKAKETKETKETKEA